MTDAATQATLGAVDYCRRAHPPKMKAQAFLSVRKPKPVIYDHENDCVVGGEGDAE